VKPDIAMPQFLLREIPVDRSEPFTPEQLRDISQEIHKIADSTDPAKVKRYSILRQEIQSEYALGRIDARTLAQVTSGQYHK
jgi:hypothetical protein